MARIHASSVVVMAAALLVVAAAGMRTSPERRLKQAAPPPADLSAISEACINGGTQVQSLCGDVFAAAQVR